MILVNSKDVVAERVKDIQAQAATSGRRRQPRNSRQPRNTWRSRAPHWLVPASRSTRTA